MSHFLTFVTNENGVVVDPFMSDDASKAMSASFGFDDVYIYSHGWWTDATRALTDYNRFSIGFATHCRLAVKAIPPSTCNFPPVGLGVGIHWPSMLSEDRGLTDKFQALSYFTMEKRADDVGEHGGYALLRTLIEARPSSAKPLRIHLLGHSFGCKVVCSALTTIAASCGPKGLLKNVEFTVVLLQAAFDDNALEPKGAYGTLIPDLKSSSQGLRLLITTSDLDDALHKKYTMARALEIFRLPPFPVALGAGGPTLGVVNLIGGSQKVSVSPGDSFAQKSPFTSPLVVANLTPLHSDNTVPPDSMTGHHSDIFREEIYGLIARFLFADKTAVAVP